MATLTKVVAVAEYPIFSFFTTHSIQKYSHLFAYSNSSRDRAAIGPVAPPPTFFKDRSKNDIKGVVSKNFLGMVPQTPTLLAPIAVQPPSTLTPLRGP